MNIWDHFILLSLGLGLFWAMVRLRHKKKTDCPGCCSCCSRGCPSELSHDQASAADPFQRHRDP